MGNLNNSLDEDGAPDRLRCGFGFDYSEFVQPGRHYSVVMRMKTRGVRLPGCPVDDPKYIPAFLEMVGQALSRATGLAGDIIDIDPSYFVTKDGGSRFLEFICALCGLQWFRDYAVVISCSDGSYASRLIMGISRDSELFTRRGYKRQFKTKNITVISGEEYSRIFAGLCVSAYLCREQVMKVLACCE